MSNLSRDPVPLYDVAALCRILQDTNSLPESRDFRASSRLLASFVEHREAVATELSRAIHTAVLPALDTLVESVRAIVAVDRKFEPMFVDALIARASDRNSQKEVRLAALSTFRSIDATPSEELVGLFRGILTEDDRRLNAVVALTIKESSAAAAFAELDNDIALSLDRTVNMPNQYPSREYLVDALAKMDRLYLHKHSPGVSKAIDELRQLEALAYSTALRGADFAGSPERTADAVRSLNTATRQADQEFAGLLLPPAERKRST